MDGRLRCLFCHPLVFDWAFAHVQRSKYQVLLLIIFIAVELLCMGIEAPRVSILSDGIIKMDGGSIFGQIPRYIWELKSKPDRLNRVSLGLNYLLVKYRGLNVLIDTGVGTKETGDLKDTYGISSGKLLRNLKKEGLSAKDINAVILTHLHFDHSGGCTKIDRSANIIPAFPKASYYVQEDCWKEAHNLNERSKDIHNAEDYSCLERSGQLVLINGDVQVLPGLNVKKTGGHCIGHQSVHINGGGEKIVFLGDIIPTSHHIDLSYIAANDQYPEETLENKRELIEEAVRDGWLVVFSHGTTTKAGYMEKRDGLVSLKPVTI